jgi:hypothetical protein
VSSSARAITLVKFLRPKDIRFAIWRLVGCAWLKLRGNNRARLSKYIVAPRLRTRTVQRKILTAVQFRLGEVLGTSNAGKENY